MLTTSNNILKNNGGKKILANLLLLLREIMWKNSCTPTAATSFGVSAAKNLAS